MTSFDVIGDIAILQKKEKNLKKFALQLLKRQKNIKAVFMKEKIIGKLRIAKLKWLAGKKDTETIHKESGCLFKLDVAKCYFSPRLSSDRLEIAKSVKKNEMVLVMFAGVAPYPIVIARHSKAKEIYAIEFSKKAVKYAKENISLNKIKNIKIIQGNVKKKIPELRKQGLRFDRIVMARPRVKEDFLKYAFMVAKKGTVIHFYDFVSSFEEAIKKINKAAKKAKKLVEIIFIKKVREIAPYFYHVRIDFKIM